MSLYRFDKKGEITFIDLAKELDEKTGNVYGSQYFLVIIRLLFNYKFFNDLILKFRNRISLRHFGIFSFIGLHKLVKEKIKMKIFDQMVLEKYGDKIEQLKLEEKQKKLRIKENKKKQWALEYRQRKNEGKIKPKKERLKKISVEQLMEKKLKHGRKVSKGKKRMAKLRLKQKQEKNESNEQ